MTEREGSDTAQAELKSALQNLTEALDMFAVPSISINCGMSPIAGWAQSGEPQSCDSEQIAPYRTAWREVPYPFVFLLQIARHLRHLQTVLNHSKATAQPRRSLTTLRLVDALL